MKMAISVNFHINNYYFKVLHLFYNIIFPDIISFQHVLHFDVGRSQIEWNLKVKSKISVYI